jgi:hypothetical protein
MFFAMRLLQVPHLLIDECNHLFNLIIENILQRLAVDVNPYPSYAFQSPYRLIPICELTMPIPG